MNYVRQYPKFQSRRSTPRVKQQWLDGRGTVQSLRSVINCVSGFTTGNEPFMQTWWPL